jgi:hypothetical protein
MVWKISIEPDVNCVFIKHYGVVEIDDIIDTAEDIFNHPDHRASMSIFHDLSDHGFQPDITYKSLAEKSKDMMRAFRSRIGQCKAAYVVGDGQNYAKVHQFTVAGRLGDYPIERKPFRDVENALRWLDLPEGYQINYPQAAE